MYSQSLQITELLKLEGTASDHVIPPSYTDQSQQKHTGQDCVQLGTEYLQSWQLCRFLGQLIPLFGRSHRKYLFIMFSFTDFS